MSLIRRIRVLLFGSLLAMAVGSLGLAVAAAARALREEATLRNAQEAASMAGALSASAADDDAGAQMLLALFDSGAFRRIRLIDAQGRLLFERQAQSVSRAPEVFAAWAALEGTPGIASLDPAGAGRSTVEVVGAAGPLVDALWSTALRFAAGLALLAGVIAAVGFGVTRSMARELDRTIAHAESLQLGEYQPVVESGTSEMRRLTRAVNALARHVRQAFDTHSAQLSLVRLEASRDPLTGLANRTHFMHQFEEATHRESGSAVGGLVLLRLLDLTVVNRVLGHPATDGVIRVIAQTLQAYTRRVDGCLVGRLNGSDFALMLPAAGVARETAEALMEVLGAALPAFGSNVAVVAGAVETVPGDEAAGLLKAADVAVRSAQGRGAFQVAFGRADAAGAGA